ncbi:MAG: arginine--tRNA ligase [Actinobacteria bacterium]|uniref:arginine--tRNA ligase n=1 Tax=freshwater metagenome TaxID=449393 RepID=A0A6J7B1Q9_9ZZZZ|nr:arginine--tRNA ligase [Actinomycetota bacterium]MSY36322.1 arginine--tRNA ligase [Actinomycetota bacterium]MTA72296.1 arginine--tRNA ligase [Actinomycetota bacterium]MTB29844.1 arginine--tRNA ligase [Actinomycetota bacterium]MUH48679.1 arginine--tRNA ligase [Actinomycetota bacterium]
MSSQLEQLQSAVLAALEHLVAEGLLDAQIPASIVLERPKNRDHGDYATSIALQLAKTAGKNPRDIAQLIADQLHTAESISRVDIAGPGFINITLNRASQAELVTVILNSSADYGKGNALAGVRINLEFISANPTGPLHLGHTRWAAVGDALGRVLSAAGADVTREFYINDRGNQMDLFGASVEAAALGKPIPDDGYQGAYISDLAKEVVAANSAITLLPEGTRHEAFREAAYAVQLKDQQRVLDTFGTHFDVWFSERSLHEQGAVEHGLEKLRKQGHVFEEEGAVWLRTTDFGDDKDRVLTKSDRSLTYFSSDTAYYINKRERGFDICIYMLGADHHGYVGRLKAIAACAGDNPDYNIHVLIGQLVKIMEGGEEVKLSKRAGTIITLEELVEKVGVDAARYTLIRYPVDTPMVMDIDVLKRNTNENPVYYVQYAHARIAAVLRNAEELKISLDAKDFDSTQLSHDRENELLGVLAQFPRVVASAAELRQPHRVARYLEELAGVYHGFYADCRVLPMGEENPSALHTARLLLCASTKQVIANGLALLGVSAPERM